MMTFIVLYVEKNQQTKSKNPKSHTRVTMENDPLIHAFLSLQTFPTLTD